MDNFHTTEDFFDHSYYKLAKFLTEITGQWPYQTRRNKICLMTLLVTSTFQILTQILAVIHYRGRSDIIFAAISPFILDVVCLVKLSNATYNSSKMRELLEWIKEDWQTVQDEERRILEKYANIGRLLGIVYLGMACATTVVFLLEPQISDVLGKLLESNYSTPSQGVYPVPMYFGGLNVDRFYYLTLIVSYFDCVAIVTATVSTDTLFIVYMQHLCGRFAGLGYTIKNLPFSRIKSKDDGFEYVCDCIVKHTRLIKFSQTVETVYVWCFLGVVGCNMMIVSITAVQAVTQMNSVQMFIKFFMFTSVQIVHLFFECFMSQQLINHSSYIRTCIDNAMWYKNTLRTQKMLIFMLMRSQLPCRLTAGKVIEMSMETFSSILQKSVSYFTVFRTV